MRALSVAMLSFTFLNCWGGAGISGLPAIGAVGLRCDCLSRRAATSYRSRPASQRKNPPRIGAGGFWTKQITLNKTPWLTGPVKRRSDFLSTGGQVLSPALNRPDSQDRSSIRHSGFAADIAVTARLDRVVQYRRASRSVTRRSGILGRPVQGPGDDGCAPGNKSIQPENTLTKSPDTPPAPACCRRAPRWIRA
jgi:hypothetical protein